MGKTAERKERESRTREVSLKVSEIFADGREDGVRACLRLLREHGHLSTAYCLEDEMNRRGWLT